MDLVPLMLFGVVVIWNIVLTYLMFSQKTGFKKFTKDGKNNSIMETVSEIIENERKTRKAIVELDKKIEGLIFESQFYIQKIGLVRFNPFNDTGGDQSFILALIDESDTGVVISGLHTRNGTRWYAKEVQNGKGVEHELSSDEKKAINAAKKRSKK